MAFMSAVVVKESANIYIIMLKIASLLYTCTYTDIKIRTFIYIRLALY